MPVMQMGYHPEKRRRLDGPLVRCNVSGCTKPRAERLVTASTQKNSTTSLGENAGLAECLPAGVPRYEPSLTSSGRAP